MAPITSNRKIASIMITIALKRGDFCVRVFITQPLELE
jgi:hypothetical protein